MSAFSSFELWIVIIGMALVTYIPRSAPLVVLQAEKLPPRVVRMLKNIPYAVLGALIFPGILHFGEQSIYGVVGGVVALGASLMRFHLVLVVLSSVAAVAITAQFV